MHTSSQGGKNPPSTNVEKTFEEDFSNHLKVRNQQKRNTLTVLGAGIGSAIAVAASPVLLPGLAVASVVGATGGYHLAKRRGKQELKKHRLGAEAHQPVEETAHALPSLSRLKFLVKWGHLQLLQYEDADVAWRCAVLDEVVQAFSPCVQKTYLLRAKKHSLEEEPEAYEAFQQLYHLYGFLQRKSALEAVEKAVITLAGAFDTGDTTAACAQRCFVTFPTILETISVMDRLSPGLQERLAQEIHASKVRGIGTPDRASKQKRLKRMVGLICEVMRRQDIQEACSDRRGFEQRVAQEEIVLGGGGSSDGGSSRHAAEVEEDVEPWAVGVAVRGASAAERSVSPRPRPRCPPGGSPLRRGVVVLPPPSGAEHELHAQSDEELEYHSCSEDDAAAAQEPRGPRAAPRPAALAALPPARARAGGGPRAGGFRARAAAFPRGDHPHSWTAFDPASFEVRSGTYLKDRRKCPSGPSLTELVNVDFMLVGEDGPVWRACDHPDMFPAHHRTSGDDRFLVVLNWVFPPYQVIITGAVDPAAEWLRGEGPQGRSWQRFVEADEKGRRDLFKMIGSVEEGPWLVKRALPKKPVLIGKKIRMDTHHEPGRHVEVVFDVSSGKAEQYATGIVCGSLKRLQLAFSALIEAREEQELPECLLVSATCLNLDPALLLSPPRVGS
ncbi:unnamed protein product [Prorocentrum cordatum]|uniref:Protein ENHANCED DISEASE RESISTANCE 2 C-terminal domain-containing protein n=1 Tax=Prorocentrum cordatum TaxID=2364126 RepID=A0ABN9UTB8_9DINO|nr:unnamed protein product [Polarella glacialis]